MENKYTQLFDEVHASQRLKTEVLSMKSTQKRAVGRHRVPAVALAACLCAVLLGTAGAAQFLGVRIDLHSDPSHPGSNYTITDGFAFFPADSFPQQVHDLAADSETADRVEGKKFRSWAEMEDFLGRDLPDSTALESARRGSDILLNASAVDQGLSSISAHGYYTLDGILFEQSALLYTDKMEQNYKEYGREGEEFQGGVIMSYDEGSAMSEETYTTPGGLTATIVEVICASDSLHSAVKYNAHFSIGGVQYRVSAETNPVGMTPADLAAIDDPTHTLEILKTVLDGFDA